MTVRHDWTPYIPEVEAMLRAGKTRREIATQLGVKETSLSSMIVRHGLAGLSPNGSATGGSSPQNTHNRIDWAPLMPTLLEMMARDESATVIAKKLGVSPASLSAAMERQVPKALRTRWKKACQEATHPKKERAEPVLCGGRLSRFRTSRGVRCSVVMRLLFRTVRSVGTAGCTEHQPQMSAPTNIASLSARWSLTSCGCRLCRAPQSWASRHSATARCGVSASISNCGVWGASPSIVVAPSLLGDTAENGGSQCGMIGQKPAQMGAIFTWMGA